MHLAHFFTARGERFRRTSSLRRFNMKARAILLAIIAIYLSVSTFRGMALGKANAARLSQTNKSIKLRTVDVPVEFASAFELERARPLELALGDFDEDGLVDLVSGYALDQSGAILLQRGNPNFIAQNDRSAQGAFLKEAQVFSLPEPPEFLISGDFTRDGHVDLIAAARNSNKLYLLAGDGHGQFNSPRPIGLPGQITALVSGELGAIVAVAISADDGARALIFRADRGSVDGEPQIRPLPAQASALALGDCDGDGSLDLVAASGRRLFIINGLRSKEVARLRLKSAPASIAIGEFAHQARLALLGGDGTISLWRKDEPIGWKEIQRISALEGSGGNLRLLKANFSGMPADDLIVIDGARWRLRLLSTDQTSGDLNAVGSFELDGEPVAALSMLANKDALDDIVVLKYGPNPLTVAMIEPQSVILVTSNADSGTGSLRDAIMQANGSSGPDVIKFNISGSTVIQLQSQLPPITETLTIDGTSQPGFAGSPLIVINGSGVGGTANGLSIMANNCAVLGIGIVGFRGDGIAIIAGNDNVIQGNTIGAAEASNSGDGVRIQTGNNNTIGRRIGANPLIPDPANAIALNSGNGVNVVSGTGNSVLSNRIFSNGRLGIDLGGDGITPNDRADVDSGPNNLQNFPVLTTAVSAGGITRISGTLSSSPNGNYTIEFFENAVCDASGNGEGQEPIGSIQVTTATDGGASFDASFQRSVQAGRSITAIATDSAGNTSEFSPCVTVQQAENISDLSITKQASSSSAPAGSNVTFTMVVTNNGPSAAPLVVVADNLPSGTTFVSCSATGGGVCGGSGNNRSVTFSSLASGASATITIVARVECSAVAGSTLINSASVTSQSVFDPNQSNNTAQASFTVTSGAGQLSVDRTSLSFGPVEPSREPNNATASIVVRNTGCAAIGLNSASFTRVDPIGGISNPDDGGFFSVPGLPISIPPVGERSISVVFSPRIPDVAGGTSGLSASEVLPSSFSTALRLNPSSGSPITINITSRVSTGVRLFASSPGGSAVTLSISGDEFIVRYNVFDSNLDISRARYVFFDRSGRAIEPEPAEIDLAGPIRERGIRAGQSISVEQRFSGARSNRDVIAVQVTVFDGEGSDTARSGSAALGSQFEGLKVEGIKLRLPVLKLPPAAGSHSLRKITK
jgi:uncharacterized repeat protein (TIGR01451 family)